MKRLSAALVLLALLTATAGAADPTADLMAAIRGGNTARVQALLDANPRLINAKERQAGFTALHVAVSKDQPSMVRLLLDRGAEVDAGNIYKQTALHLCAQFNNVTLARLLLSHGANVNARTKFGVTPLRLALANHNQPVADLLRSRGGTM